MSYAAESDVFHPTVFGAFHATGNAIAGTIIGTPFPNIPRHFPFGFCRQAFTSPFAIGHCIIPGDMYDGIILFSF